MDPDRAVALAEEARDELLGAGDRQAGKVTDWLREHATPPPAGEP